MADWQIFLLTGVVAYWAYTVDKKLSAIQEELGQLRTELKELLPVESMIDDD